MPILPNAKKNLRRSTRKQMYNQRVRSLVKTTTDEFKADPSQEKLAAAFSAIDKAVKRNIFHKNKAARKKSQLSKILAETEK
jgi:small subunit ribosomal protein S20